MNEKQRIEGQQVEAVNSPDKKSVKYQLILTSTPTPVIPRLQATFRNV
ncbi:hypothetical protein [Bacillus canaveralius]|nr:hypothetical protein [Bacillus canaveralius]